MSQTMSFISLPAWLLNIQVSSFFVAVTLAEKQHLVNQSPPKRRCRRDPNPLGPSLRRPIAEIHIAEEREEEACRRK